MHGLDPKVVVYHLVVKNGARLVKQAQRRFRPDLVPLIEIEVNKLIEVGFIREVKYPTWVSSIVPIRKKNGQIRVRVDFRDLNNTCPKYEFPLPIPELMIDATTGYEAMLLMDGTSGYNQIRMAPNDEELTAFRSPKVTSGKFLGFIVRHSGIEIDQVKVDAILKMPEPRGIHELKSLQGNHLMKKGVPFKWDQACSNPFESIKSYLMKPPVLAAPYTWKDVDTIRFSTRKAIKGQALADFLADHPIPDDWELTDELPDEDAMVIEVQPPWKMYFDGASHHRGAGVGVVFVTSQGSYEAKKPELCPYHDYAKKLMGWLGDVTIQHVPRKENKKADALAALASSLTLPYQAQVTVCQKWVVPLPNEAEGEENELKHLVAISEIEKEEWRQPVIDYLCYRILPKNPQRRTEIHRCAPRFL
ncbi:uncharacterized protein [Nicotiana sylvestris]|uniref:uncharacterized protein n=1 Tax=Nicotiana sylvestris TaxID=4096 RepID=UPI00388CBE98